MAKAIQNSVPYEKTFGGLVVYHRHTRQMTEQVLADELKRLAQNEQQLSGDHIVQWEKNEAVPRSPKVYKALVEILINENAAIPEEKKETARVELARAHEDASRYLDNGHNGTKPASATKFGELVNIYRRQRGLIEDKLAEEVYQRATIKPIENIHTIGYELIAQIQANAVVPSEGLVRLMERVFDRTKLMGQAETTGITPLHHMDPDEKEDFRAAWEQVKDRAPSAAANGNSPGRAHDAGRPQANNRQIEVTPQIRDLQATMRSLFVGSTGKALTVKQITESLQQIDPELTLSPQDAATLFNTRENSVAHPLTQWNIDKLKPGLAMILLDLNPAVKDTAVFEQTFDALRLALLEQHALQTGRRPNAAATAEQLKHA